MSSAHDFDFLRGTWTVHHRKLADMLGKGGDDAEWVEFESVTISQPILGGLGNVDTYDVASFPGRPEGFQGFALRLFDAEHAIWRIWWASSIGGGLLEPPVLGGFAGGRGEFEGDDTVGGKSVRVRFVWDEIAENSARWQQAFSTDGGATFVTNWIMQFVRSS